MKQNLQLKQTKDEHIFQRDLKRDMEGEEVNLVTLNPLDEGFVTLKCS